MKLHPTIRQKRWMAISVILLFVIAIVAFLAYREARDISARKNNLYSEVEFISGERYWIIFQSRRYRLDNPADVDDAIAVGLDLAKRHEMEYAEVDFISVGMRIVAVEINRASDENPKANQSEGVPSSLREVRGQ